MRGSQILGVVVVAAWVAGCASGGQHGSDYSNCMTLSDDASRAAACTRAIESGALTDTSLVSAYVQRGDSYQMLHQPALAESDYSAAAAIDPANGQLRYMVGHAQFNQARYEEAIVTISEALELDPDQPWAYRFRGWARSHLLDYEGALADFSSSIDGDPRDAENWYGRALTEMRLYQFDQSAADFQTAMKIDPDYPIARLVYPELLVYIGDLEGALAYYEAFADKYSGHNVLHERCWVLAALGNVEDALPLCDEGIERLYESEIAFEHAAYAALRAGDFITARRHFETALALDEDVYWWSDARIRYGYAALLRLTEDIAGAEEQLALARAADPRIEERMMYVPYIPAGEI